MSTPTERVDALIAVWRSVNLEIECPNAVRQSMIEMIEKDRAEENARLRTRVEELGNLTTFEPVGVVKLAQDMRQVLMALLGRLDMIKENWVPNDEIAEMRADVKRGEAIIKAAIEEAKKTRE